MPPKKRTTKSLHIDTNLPNLVIVESPAKAKTIKKYLGKDFEVTASMGHIVDLAKGNDAIDKHNNFQPSYVVSSDKKPIVSALKKAAKSMQKVWLATDEDREGEAIAWHLCRELQLDITTTPRIVFHEITQQAIQHAVEHPRRLDIDLVNAQQARRVLDRLVGFDLSPVLRRKVKSGLSAGRVQSVAVKLLVEREREVQSFSSISEYKIKGSFLTHEKAIIEAEMKQKYPDAFTVETLLGNLGKSAFVVKDLEQVPGTKHPSPPFTTSSIQQAASTKLGFSVTRTMQLAQRLYEAGHISYMRTDSMNLSQQAIGAAKKYITNEYGVTYSASRNFSTKDKNAQQAHECIRPTDFTRLVAGEDDAQKKLYRLIRQRTIASQMAPAQVEKTTLTLQPSEVDDVFVAKGEVVTFDGFLAVYTIQERSKESILPPVQVGDTLERVMITAGEQFQKPPARYTEASLVKKLEELGIGRPSTYAPTISTIQKRGYVEAGIAEGVPTIHHILTLDKQGLRRSEEVKKLGSTKGKLVPTSIGMVVTDFLDEHFPKIMAYQFTAKVEEEFDDIAEGTLEWQTMIKNFYTPFEETVKQVTNGAERASGERILGNDTKTGRPVSVRIGRYGPLVQIGLQGEEDIKYASLPHGLNMETVTLDEALEGFALPRELGEWEGKQIKANIGRFGPYVQWGSVFASLKQPDDPYKIEYARSLELIQDKIHKDKERTLQEFVYEEKPGVIMKSRRSDVIKWNRKTIKLPKGSEGATMSYDEITRLIEQEIGTKKKTTKKKITRKKKPVAKK